MHLRFYSFFFDVRFLLFCVSAFCSICCHLTWRITIRTLLSTYSGITVMCNFVLPCKAACCLNSWYCRVICNRWEWVLLTAVLLALVAVLMHLVLLVIYQQRCRLLAKRTRHQHGNDWLMTIIAIYIIIRFEFLGSCWVICDRWKCYWLQYCRPRWSSSRHSRDTRIWCYW